MQQPAPLTLHPAHARNNFFRWLLAFDPQIEDYETLRPLLKTGEPAASLLCARINHWCACSIKSAVLPRPGDELLRLLKSVLLLALFLLALPFAIVSMLFWVADSGLRLLVLRVVLARA